MEILPGVPYPAFRLLIILIGLLVALLIYFIVARTKLGMLIRAGASNREMAGALESTSACFSPLSSVWVQASQVLPE